MVKLHNVLYANIWGNDIIFDLISVERSANTFTTKLVYEYYIY